MAKLNINRKDEDVSNTFNSIQFQTGGSLESLSSEYRLDGLKNFYEKKSLTEIDKKPSSARPNSSTKDMLPLSANRQQNTNSPFIPGHSLPVNFFVTNDSINSFKGTSCSTKI